MNKKERIDVLLVEQGLVETREGAKRAIMAGLVYAGSERLEKPGIKIDRSTVLTLKGDPLPYVSRGGLKLAKAIAVFNLDLNKKIVLDIGASTGGFTDCSLQHGAMLVYALDVGYNQLAWKLRQDERVYVMERTNFRYVKRDDFPHGLPDVATIDVSFISLQLILPVLKTILVDSSNVVALVKPQFEAGKEDVGKKGVVRNQRVHERVLSEISEFAFNEGYSVKGIDFSPITGGEGNIEFLLHLHWHSEKKDEIKPDEYKNTIKAVVEQSYQQLRGE